VFGTSAVTAVTAQNTMGVFAWEALPVALVARQIDVLADDLPPAAVKSGMLGSVEIVQTVAERIAQHRLPNYVLDPVMVAASGDRLLAPDAVEVLRSVLVPRALIITPNLPEAAALLAQPLAESEAEMRRQTEQLMKLGARAVLVKGGHGIGPESVDIFFDGTAELRLPAPRIATENTHGTGCTLSSAIAAGLAKRLPLAEAVYALVLAGVVVVLLAATFTTEDRVDRISDHPGLEVDVTAFQWGWRFTYPGDAVTVVGDDRRPPTLVVPTDTTVRFTLESRDVIHSFWIPELRFKKDAFPERENTFDLSFEEEDAVGRCAEFCGLAHGEMTFDVLALEPPDFRDWLRTQRRAGEIQHRGNT